MDINTTFYQTFQSSYLRLKEHEETQLQKVLKKMGEIKDYFTLADVRENSNLKSLLKRLHIKDYGTYPISNGSFDITKEYYLDDRPILIITSKQGCNSIVQKCVEPNEDYIPKYKKLRYNDK